MFENSREMTQVRIYPPIRPIQPRRSVRYHQHANPRFRNSESKILAPEPIGPKKNKKVSLWRYFKVDMSYAMRVFKAAPYEGTGLIIRYVTSFFSAYSIFLLIQPLADLGWNIRIMDQTFMHFQEVGVGPGGILAISFFYLNLGIWVKNCKSIYDKAKGIRRTPPPRLIRLFGNVLESTGYLMRSFMFAGFVFVNAIRNLQDGEKYFGLQMMAIIIPGVYIGRIIEKIGNNFTWPRKSHLVSEDPVVD